MSLSIAQRTTADDLGGALRSIRNATRSRAIDRAIDDMPRRARASLAAIDRRCAASLIAEPHKFWRLHLGHYETPDAAIAACRNQIAVQQRLGRRNDWLYDFNKLVSLRGAAIALRYLRRFGDPENRAEWFARREAHLRGRA